MPLRTTLNPPPPLGGGGGGDSGGSGNWIRTLVKTAIAVGLTAVATLYTHIYINRKPVDTNSLVKSLSKMLENNILEAMAVDYLVPTPAISQLALQPRSSYQTMVCGPRGVGKSTAVYKAMEGKKGVVHIPLRSCNQNHFFSTALQRLKFKHHEVADEVFLTQALEDIRHRKGNKTTFIVEINEKCSEKELTSLFLLLKHLASDQGLATFIVVLSTP